jgi:maleate isomerase
MNIPHRVGLIVPSSNVTTETELPELMARHRSAASPGFTFHSSRAVLHRVDAESLRRMVGESDRCARELADARVDVVAYACLIAIMAEGRGAHEASESRLAATLAAAGCVAPVTSSAGALVRSLQRLDAKRVALVAPYVRSLTQVVIDYLAAYGIEVVSSVSLEVDDNVAVGRLDPSRLVAHAAPLDMLGVDAVVLSACVQMPSLPAINDAEQEFDLPVLSASTATAHEVLELLGEEPYVPRAGAALAPLRSVSAPRLWRSSPV